MTFSGVTGPPFFQASRQQSGIPVRCGLICGLGKPRQTLLVVLSLPGNIGISAVGRNHFLGFEMKTHVFPQNPQRRLECIKSVFLLDEIMQKIDGRNNSAVLFVQNRDTGQMNVVPDYLQMFFPIGHSIRLLS